MSESILKGFEVWSDALGVKSKGRVRDIDNISLDGISRLRELILDLAIRGKLTAQNSDDEPANNLLAKLEIEKKKLIKEGRFQENPFNDKEPFEIPSLWRWTYLGNIALDVHYGFNAAANDLNKTVRLLRITDIQDDNVNWDTVPGCEISQDQISNYLLENGDILIARTGGTIGKSYLVSNLTLKSVFASYLIRVKKLPSSYPDFIKVYLKSAFYWKQLYESSMGTGQPNVNGTSLKKLLVPFPPLAEQKRIVAKVDELMALCDKLEYERRNHLKTHHGLTHVLLETLANSFDVNTLRASWERILQQFDSLFYTEDSVDQLKEALLQLAIRGQFGTQNGNDISAKELLNKIEKELTEKFGKEYSQKLSRDKSTIEPSQFHYPIPDRWQWCELQDLAVLFNGKAHEQLVDEKGKYILINSSFVSSEGKVFKTVSSQLTPLSKGEITIVMSDVPGGKALVKCFLVEEDNKYSLNQRIGGISASSLLNINFLMLVLNRNKYYLQYDDGKKQTNLKKIQILSCPIPLPPYEEQQRIVSKVNELFELCDSLKSKIERANEINLSLSKTVLEVI